MSNHIRIPCPSCSQTLKLRPEYMGRRLECKYCGTRFRAEAPEPSGNVPVSTELAPEEGGASLSDTSIKAMLGLGADPDAGGSSGAPGETPEGVNTFAERPGAQALDEAGDSRDSGPVFDPGGFIVTRSGLSASASKEFVLPTPVQQIEKLERRLEAELSELDGLRKEFRNARKIMAENAKQTSLAHDQELTHLRKERDTLSAALEALRAESAAKLAESQAAGASAAEERRRTQKTLDDAIAELKTSQARITSIESNYADLIEHRDRTLAELEALRAEHAATTERAQAEAGRLSAQAAEERSTAQRLAEELQSARAESERALAEARSTHESHRDSLTAEHGSALAALTEKHDQYVQSLLGGFEIDKRAFSERHDATARELDLLRSGSDQEKRDLAERIAAAERSLEAAASARLGLEGELARAREEAERLRGAGETLAAELSQARAEAEALEGRLTGAAESARAELERATEERTRLEAELRHRTDELDGLRRDLESAVGALGEKESARAALEAELHRASAELQDIHSSHDLSRQESQGRFESLEADHKRTLDDLHGRLGDLSSRNGELEAAIAEHRSSANDRENLARELEAANARVAALQSELETKDARFEAVAKELEQTTWRLQNERQEHQDAIARGKTELDSVVARLVAEKDRFHSAIDQAIAQAVRPAAEHEAGGGGAKPASTPDDLREQLSHLGIRIN